MLKFVIIIIFTIIPFVPARAHKECDVCDMYEMCEKGKMHDKYEVRATWLTTLGGLDWPAQRATSAKGIEQQKAEPIVLPNSFSIFNF